MKTIRNKTLKPLKIHLARGKVLHLGPRKEGQISTPDAERESFKKMVEAGEVEVLGEGSGPVATAGNVASAHPDSRGHHPALKQGKRGDR